jgi:hypothetical protein
MAKPGTFRKVDLTRAIEAARAGGVPVGRIEIEGAKIVLVAATETNSGGDALDKWMRDNAG